MEQNPSQFADIYDRLNNQPHLQEIIKQKYYESVLTVQRAHDLFQVNDTLSYAFNNVRKHQEEVYGCEDEADILRFMKDSVFYEIVGNNKFGPIRYGFKGVIEDFYGSEFVSFYDKYSDSEDDLEYYENDYDF